MPISRPCEKCWDSSWRCDAVPFRDRAPRGSVGLSSYRTHAQTPGRAIVFSFCRNGFITGPNFCRILAAIQSCCVPGLLFLVLRYHHVVELGKRKLLVEV